LTRLEARWRIDPIDAIDPIDPIDREAVPHGVEPEGQLRGDVLM
jgi:hypothetical protein